jgi:hypothetical protein
VNILDSTETSIWSYAPAGGGAPHQDRPTDLWSQRDFDSRSLSLKNSWLASQSIVAVAEVRRQFGNPEEREHAPLEAITRRLVKIQQSDKF